MYNKCITTARTRPRTKKRNKNNKNKNNHNNANSNYDKNDHINDNKDKNHSKNNKNKNKIVSETKAARLFAEEILMLSRSLLFLLLFLLLLLLLLLTLLSFVCLSIRLPACLSVFASASPQSVSFYLSICVFVCLLPDQMVVCLSASPIEQLLLHKRM